MAARTTLLEEALEAWQFARDGVIDELRNLPDKDLSFRPSPKSRSALELVQHIVESGLMMPGASARDWMEISAEIPTSVASTSTGSVSPAGGRKPLSSRRCARRTRTGRRR